MWINQLMRLILRGSLATIQVSDGLASTSASGAGAEEILENVTDTNNSDTNMEFMLGVN